MSIQIEAHRNLEGLNKFNLIKKKLDTSFLIEESVGERKDPFANQVEKASKAYQGDFSYNSLWRSIIKLNSMDDLTESKKIKYKRL